MKCIKGPNDLPLRDKNGRFKSNKNAQISLPQTRYVKILHRTTGIANRLRKRPQQNSTKDLHKKKERRVTRSMRRSSGSNSNSKALSPREEAQSSKKRCAKSIEKDISFVQNNYLEETKLEQEVQERKLTLKHKRVPIYQEYDDFIK